MNATSTFTLRWGILSTGSIAKIFGGVSPRRFIHHDMSPQGPFPHQPHQNLQTLSFTREGFDSHHYFEPRMKYETLTFPVHFHIRTYFVIL